MSDYAIKSPRKLIEVALPLDAINEASARIKRKSPGGYPTTLHRWFAQRPLPAARAVLFAQLVNDPGYQQGNGFKYGKNKKEAAEERKRLFKIIDDLVLWENTTNEVVMEAARVEIRRSWREICDLNRDHPQAAHLFDPEKLPVLNDPFAGGGSIPLEAQRLGLSTLASDLNPVAVLINMAMIDIPARFLGTIPVGGNECNGTLKLEWAGTSGLAEDIIRYGRWIHKEAYKRIGHLYPPVEITAEIVRERPDLQPLLGQRLTVVAYLWVRTVSSPNPAFSHVKVPLASSFVLSTKAGHETYVQPIIEGDKYYFAVKVGTPPADATSGTKLTRGANFKCLLSQVAIAGSHIKSEGSAHRMGTKMLAVIAEGAHGRVYLSPTTEMQDIASKAEPKWKPDLLMPDNPRWFSPPFYGIKAYGDLFTKRQLVALTTLCDLVIEVREKVRLDAISSGMIDDDIGLDAGGTSALAYAEAISLYLAFAISRVADYGSALATWRPKDSAMRASLSIQALPMTWDFAEGTPFGKSSSGFTECVKVISKVLSVLPSRPRGIVVQRDAASKMDLSPALISTDPPYYDNVGYADLSDFFYIWLRRSMKSIFPNLFSTLAAPKAEELVASPYRHGGGDKAEAFFLTGMTSAIAQLAARSYPGIPITIYYAFKQSETIGDITSSSGWETFLDAIIRAGLTITGTWPVRTEGDNRRVSNGNNALASSIVIVCRKRPIGAPTIARREFLRELNTVLPEALDAMTRGAGSKQSPVAPVDLSQAIIGPGMAVFSKYTAVLEADGSPMSVRTALQLINRFLAEDDFDADTQFCLHWFEQHNWSEGPFGTADTLSRGKGTSVDGMKDAGVLQSGGGKVRLLRWAEYPADWDPRTDARTPIWEALHQLIRALKQGGESASGALLALLGGKAEAVRQLAYRLYTLCERLGQAEDARAYNELITSWTGIETVAAHAPKPADLTLDL